MEAINEIRLAVFADELQFYIQDETADGYLLEWTAKAGERLLATTDGMIAIGTLRNAFLPIAIKTFDEEPPFLSLKEGIIDQINESDLEVSSGKIVIAGIGDDFNDVKKVKLIKGIYRARIYYGNLSKLDEFYEIHLWITNKRHDLAVIKSRQAKPWNELFKKEDLYPPSNGLNFN